MKKKVFLLIISISVLLFSCKKTDNTTSNENLRFDLKLGRGFSGNPIFEKFDTTNTRVLINNVDVTTACGKLYSISGDFLYDIINYGEYDLPSAPVLKKGDKITIKFLHLPYTGKIHGTTTSALNISWNKLSVYDVSVFSDIPSSTLRTSFNIVDTHTTSDLLTDPYIGYYTDASTGLVYDWYLGKAVQFDFTIN